MTMRQEGGRVRRAQPLQVGGGQCGAWGAPDDAAAAATAGALAAGSAALAGTAALAGAAALAGTAFARAAAGDETREKPR